MQLHQRVRADDIEKVSLGIFLAQKGQGIDGIDHALPIQLDAAGGQGFLLGAGGADHFPAILRRGDMLLVGRVARGHHQHPVQPGLLLRGQGHADMPRVDGIEGAAHDSDAFLGQPRMPPFVLIPIINDFRTT